MSRVRVALDSNLSPRLVGVLESMYGHKGYEFTHVDDLVPAGTGDTIWADVFKKFGGRIVLSGDYRIATRPHEAIAFIDNGFTAFFPDQHWPKLRSNGQAAFLVHHWPEIEAAINSEGIGTCWRMKTKMNASGIILGKIELERLQIPDEVLNVARTKKAK